MKIKIVSDGTSNGTRIIDVETGKALENVSWLRWEINATDMRVARLTMELVAVPVELIASKVSTYPVYENSALIGANRKFSLEENDER